VNILEWANNRSASLVRQALFLFVAFLVLFTFHSWAELGALKKQTNKDFDERLHLITRAVSRELGLRKGSQIQTVQLLDLKERLGIKQISLLDRKQRSLVDTSPSVMRGAIYTHLGVEPSLLERVWDGHSLLSQVYQDASDEPVKAAFYPLIDPSSKVQGILRITVNLPTGGSSGVSTATGLLLKIFGGVAFGVLVYYGARSVVLSQRRGVGSQVMAGRGIKAEDLGKKDATGFVVDTFQTLIQQLMEKEQELERLRRVAEERADHIENYNENILRSVSSGVITFNQEEVITTFNLAAERILGLSGSSVIGQSCHDVFEKDSQVCQLVQKALLHKEITVRQELELGFSQANLGQAGRKWAKIWVGVSTSLLTDKNDRVIGTTMVFTDISEIKRLQEQMELKKRLTMLGEMSAGIAHEFRNYMGTILGYAKLLAKKVGSGHTASAMIQSIVEELGAMEQLIHQLLDFSRSIELNLQPVDIGMLLQRVVQRSLEQATGTLPKLTLIISPELGTLQLDEVLIRQALGNLIKNAVEAMPEGGELKVQAGFRTHSMLPVTQRGGRMKAPFPGKEVEIEIQDTGDGIPRDVQDRIFLPFFTTKEKGTGLGLALVHKIIVSHSGQIQVDSQTGKGTTFRVYLPCEGKS